MDISFIPLMTFDEDEEQQIYRQENDADALVIKYLDRSSIQVDVDKTSDAKIKITWQNSFVKLDPFGFIKSPFIEVVNNAETKKYLTILYDDSGNEGQIDSMVLLILTENNKTQQVIDYGQSPEDFFNLVGYLWMIAYNGTPNQVLLEQYNKMTVIHKNMFVQAYKSDALEVKYDLQDRIVESITLENIVPNRVYYAINYNPAQANFNATVLTMQSLASILSVGNKEDPRTRAVIASIRKVTFTPKPFVGLKRRRSIGGGKKRSLKKRN